MAARGSETKGRVEPRKDAASSAALCSHGVERLVTDGGAKSRTGRSSFSGVGLFSGCVQKKNLYVCRNSDFVAHF